MPWKETNTVTLREEFILKALGKQKPFTALCEEYGISRKTGYKWMERFRQGGLPALHDESRRPRNNPNAVREEVVCELIRIKKTIPSIWGPKKVLEIYRCRYGESEEISLSSVKRILDHAGFVLHRRRPRQGGMARIQEGIVPKAANELWTVDFKGWWKTRDHSRCEPLTVRDGFSRFLLDAYFGPKRPLISVEKDHPFRSKKTRRFGGNWSTFRPISEIGGRISGMSGLFTEKVYRSVS
jgi:putative transposase